MDVPLAGVFPNQNICFNFWFLFFFFFFFLYNTLTDVN